MEEFYVDDRPPETRWPSARRWCALRANGEVESWDSTREHRRYRKYQP